MKPASIEDWFEINNLFTQYTTSLDRGDLEGVAACFTEDGVIDSPLMGIFRGREGIRAFADRTKQVSRDRGAQFRHMVSNLTIVTDGTRAHATCYFLDYLTTNGKTELLSPGVYNCDLVRDGGKWLFEARRVTLDQVFPIKMPDSAELDPRTL